MSTPPTRSNSSSTTSSRTSSISLSPSLSRLQTPPPSYDLALRATQILTSLASINHTSSTPPPSTLHLPISPTITFQHNDNPKTTSLTSYLTRFTSSSTETPITLSVKEACVDETQRKVWVLSELSGFPDGVVKESVDMLFFDEEGVLVRGVDSLRIKRRG